MQRQGTGGSVAIRSRAAGILLLAAHLLLVSWLALRPLDVPWVSAANLEPLAGIKANLALGPAEAVHRIGGGLLLLAPLGILLPMAGGRLAVSPLWSLARTVTAGALISLTIELLQTGVPGRVLDVDSLLLNTAGVAIAHLLVVPLGRARLRRRGRPGPPVPRGRGPRPAPRRTAAGRGPEAGAVLREGAAQGATPTITRVGIAP
ncbi:VanZ family protein [Streptomyces sp. CAU 1734]|uniref:VanZ family protein n=1 Tax=Streptomyces sp. CAU 1734 TaxID=3140360 RepID=UPI0032616CBC